MTGATQPPSFSKSKQKCAFIHSRVWRNCASSRASPQLRCSSESFLWYSTWTIVSYLPAASCLLSSCFTSSVFFTHQNTGGQDFLSSSTLTRTSMIDIIFFNLLHPQKVPWNNTLGIYGQSKPGVRAQKGYCHNLCVLIATGSLLLLNKACQCARLQREGWLTVLLIHLHFSFVKASSFNLPGDI